MPSITISDSAKASTPGNIRVSRIQWFKAYPVWPSIWAGSLAISSLLLLLYSPFWLVLVVPLLVMNWLYWVHLSEHFNSGNLCPAEVISISPFLLAVGTDMRTGTRSQPAIKVVTVPSASLSKSQKLVGAKVATVALYSGDSKKVAWENFYPKPVGAVIADSDIVDASISRIPPKFWEEFYSWKALVPELSPGLHRIGS